MKNPFASILQNKRILWSIIVAVPLILIIVILLLLNFGGNADRTSDSEQMTKEEDTESQKPTFAIASEEDMLDREWALIALEKKALEERESQIERKLSEIEVRYQQLKEAQQQLQKDDSKLDERVRKVKVDQNKLAEKEQDLSQRELELEIAKEKKEREEQKTVEVEEPVEDKIAKEKQLKKVAKGFETMRARDAADILINMLEKDRENVLNLLRVMDNRTRTRIISAISKEQINIAADLTKEMMEVQ